MKHLRLCLCQQLCLTFRFLSRTCCQELNFAAVRFLPSRQSPVEEAFCWCAYLRLGEIWAQSLYRWHSWFETRLRKDRDRSCSFRCCARCRALKWLYECDTDHDKGLNLTTASLSSLASCAERGRGFSCQLLWQIPLFLSDPLNFQQIPALKDNSPGYQAGSILAELGGKTPIRFSRSRIQAVTPSALHWLVCLIQSHFFFSDNLYC